MHETAQNPIPLLTPEQREQLLANGRQGWTPGYGNRGAPPKVPRQRDATHIFAALGQGSGHLTIVADTCHPFVRRDGFHHDGFWSGAHLPAVGEILMLQPRSAADYWADITGAECWNIPVVETKSATVEWRTTP